MTIPIEKFGKDHWSTLTYLESRCVDHMGIPALPHMRCDRDRHPFYAHVGTIGKYPTGKYPTILRDSERLANHDDWDCIDDLEAAGLLEQIGTGTNPRVELTDYGWAIAGELRIHKARGGSFTEFTL